VLRRAGVQVRGIFLELLDPAEGVRDASAMFAQDLHELQVRAEPEEDDLLSHLRSQMNEGEVRLSDSRLEIGFAPLRFPCRLGLAI
jgi:hypothetical protein